MNRHQRGLRLFFAIPLPAETKAAVADVQRRLGPQVSRASWVRPDAMHLTLRFLGDTSPGFVQPLVQALSRAVAEQEEFSVTLMGGGCFPSPRRPRVLWLGLRDAGRTSALAEALERELVCIGVAPAVRPYRPHLTLCRLRDRRSAAAPRELSALGEVTRFQVHQVLLFQSELHASGARHIPLARADLQAPP